jgi:hypothetical protein
MIPEKPEPSVLDYLKALLTPWRGPAPEIPPLVHEEQPQEQMILPDDRGRLAGPGFIEWLSGHIAILVLFFALTAQFFIEPPRRNWPIGVGFYFVSLILLLWSLWRRSWSLPIIPQPVEVGYSFDVFRTPLYFGLPLILLSFLLFSGNRYTDLNLLAWLVTGTAFLAALWLPQKNGLPVWRRLFTWFSKREWQLHITPWHILIVVAVFLAAFFRFYHLAQVPGEMFSDHAEKLLDVADLINGQHKIFFERNTGREDFQFYLTAVVANLFGTGLSFLSLKLGTTLAGFFTLPYIYRLGKEIGSRWVGLFAFVLAGIAYWPNVISRVGLRFPLYPLFAAPMLFYLIRGIRRSDRNDFIKAGIALGLALHGYSASRLLPVVVLVAIAIYLLHRQSSGKRTGTLWALVVLILISTVVFLPLLRYWTENPAAFGFRAFSRLATTERAYPAPVGLIFLANLGKSLIMPFWDDNNIWVHSVINRPALDVITAALFFLGLVLVIVRYFRKHDWVDLFLLVSIPLLMMPSILSLAFPEENPSLNRSGGAYIPIFIIAAIGLESLISSLLAQTRSRGGRMAVAGLTLALLGFSAGLNYDLVFNQYSEQFLNGAWNTSQIGEVIRGFSESTGEADHAYVIPYPYWVDTRLVGINAGFPLKDYALPADQIRTTVSIDAPKLFIVNPSDQATQETLRQVYPLGREFLFAAGRDGKDFLIYSIP